MVYKRFRGTSGDGVCMKQKNKAHPKQEKKVSNYDWHFQYWNDHYQDIMPEYLFFAEQTEKLIKKGEKLLKQAKNIEANRREHSVRMGVGIKTSDAKYNDEVFIAQFNKAIKDLVEMRKQYQRPDDIQIFGYTSEELDRKDRLIDANPEILLDDILINNNVTKRDCLNWLIENDFEMPTMYKLGYQNNNCIGCVKGGMGYWNAIRKDFPEAFGKMAKLEREIGHSVCRESYLDELAPDRGNFKKDQPPSCGFNCEWKQEDLLELTRTQND